MFKSKESVVECVVAVGEKPEFGKLRKGGPRGRGEGLRKGSILGSRMKEEEGVGRVVDNRGQKGGKGGMLKGGGKPFGTSNAGGMGEGWAVAREDMQDIVFPGEKLQFGRVQEPSEWVQCLWR